MTNLLGFRIILTLLWAVLWESFSVPHLAVGFLLATLLTRAGARLRRRDQAPQARPELTAEN